MPRPLNVMLLAALACSPAAPQPSGRLGEAPATDPLTETSAVAPSCDEDLSISPSDAAVLPGGLLTLTTSGGSGSVTFEVDDPDLGTVHPTLGGLVASDLEGVSGTVTATDAVCDQTALATVRIVGPPVVQPERAVVSPGVTLTPTITGGSGEWACTLTSASSGGTLAGCTWTAGPSSGRDVLRVIDSQTGAFVDVDLDVEPGASLSVPGHAGVFIPTESSWTPAPTHGSFVLDLEVLSGPLIAHDGVVSAEGAGSGRVRITDAFTGESLEVPVTGISPLVTDEPRDGERTSAGHVIPLGDVNGDGYVDAALAFIEPSVEHHYGGIVAVYAGTADGLEAEPVQVFAGSRALETLGRAVATADVDGDGRQDLLIGADRTDKGFINVGAVHMHAATPGGFFQETPWRTLYGQVQFARFGSAIAVCDFDGDGHDDLAIGALDESDIAAAEPADDQGAVHVFRGGPKGFVDQADFILYGASPSEGGFTPAPDSHLGTTLAAGDIDGDGLCDLVAGAPEAADEDGLAFVYSGHAIDILSREPVAWFVGPEGERGELGRRVSLGDVDGDARAEILLSGWRTDDPADDAGVAWLHRGAVLSGAIHPDDAAWFVRGAAGTDHLGSDVALQDLDLDGVPDVVVGAYRQESELINQGAVHVWVDVAATFDAGRRVEAGEPTWTAWGQERYDRLGQAAALIGDLDLDRVSDLFSLAGFSSALGPEAGQPFYSLYSGDPVPLDLPGGPAGHEYGLDVAIIDIDGDDRVDLLVGAPGTGKDDIGGNAGGVYIHAGTGDGGFAAEPVPWAGTFPSWTGSDRFGYALSSAGDFDGDGYEDLAVAARSDSQPTTWDASVINPDECGGYAALAGGVFIYRGGPDGIATAPSFVHYAPEAYGYMERLAGPLDADGDGLDDLAVGSMGWGTGGGFALLRGRPADPEGLTVICEADSWWGTDPFQRVGSALAPLGDLDGDGCDELVVGATGEELHPDWNNQGAVRVMWGAGPACTEPDPQQTFLGVKIIGTGLGSGLAGQLDVDGDGLPDLLSGAAEYRVDFAEAGAAWLTPGWWLQDRTRQPAPPGDLSLPEDTAWSYLVPDDGIDERYGLVGGSAAGLFGAAVALVPDPADAEGALVAVGAPRGQQGGTWLGGAVVIHRFGPDGLEPVPAWLVAGESRRGSLGATLEAATIDGRTLLIVGAPDSYQAGTEVGAVYVVELE